MFERIVSCTKQSQYFYISPKLLQALTSMEDDDVTVLLVLNGPGLRMVCAFSTPAPGYFYEPN